MFGENADRRNAAPISSATEWKMFLNISSRVGSTFGARRGWVCGFRLVLGPIGPRFICICPPDLAIGIHLNLPPCRYQRCRAVFGNHGRACEGLAVAQL